MNARRLYLLLPALGLAACTSTTINKSANTLPSSPGGSSAPAETPGISVTSPVQDAQVRSPFTLTATATECSSQPISSIGYMLDTSTTPAIVSGTAVNTQVSSTTGAHTLHVIAYGNQGSTCDTDVAVVVMPATSTAPSGPVAPASAIAVEAIQSLSGWAGEHDTDSGDGASSGATDLTASPSQSGSARAFHTSFTNAGGERYSVIFGVDPTAKNFLYDGWIYLASPSDSIANIEMDTNQVLTNGQTVIFGMQCDGYSGTWDYTRNSGTPEAPIAAWVHSTAACNPRQWATDTWHHVQITYSRDDAGNITYQSVWLDGAGQDIYQTVPSAFALNWSSVLLTNFQVDGLGPSGSNTVYLDNLTITRW